MFEKISFPYLFYFYCYVFRKKKSDFFIFFILTFVFTLLPYIIVWYSVLKLDEVNQKSFYGDGSIIALCSGILCSYLGILFDFKGDDEKKDNILINLLLIILYIILILVFKECQLNFNRSWQFIYGIFIVSGIVLIITFFCSLYLNFRVRVKYNEVQEFIEERRSKKLEKNALKVTKSKSGIEI